MSKKKKKHSWFESFVEGLGTDPPATEQDKFANYGYFAAHYEMGEITLEELVKLQKMIGVTNDEAEDLTI